MTADAGIAPANPWAGFNWTKRGEDGRTHEPIHARSRPSLGELEPTRRITPKQREGWLEAYDRFAKAARPTGLRRGSRVKDTPPGEKVRYHCLAHAARQVLDYFLTMAVNTGRVHPSMAHIAGVLDLPRSLVQRCVDQLEQFGWIRRERRFRRNSKPDGEPGPKLEQDTNWYHVQLPDAAAALLKAWQRRVLKREEGPHDPAADAVRARAAARAKLERQRAGLEQNLRQVREYYARATRPHDLRKFATMEQDLQASIAALLSRLALLSDAASDARVGQYWDTYEGGESPSLRSSINQKTRPRSPPRP